MVYGNYDCQLSATASIKSSNVTLNANKTYVFYGMIKGSLSDNYTISLHDSADDSELASKNITSAYLNKAFAMENGIIAATEQEYKPAEQKSPR